MTDPDGSVPSPHTIADTRPKEAIAHGALAQDTLARMRGITGARPAIPEQPATPPHGSGVLVLRASVAASVVASPDWTLPENSRHFALRTFRDVAEWTDAVGKDGISVVPQFIVEVGGQKVSQIEARAWWNAMSSKGRQLVATVWLGMTVPTGDEGNETAASIAWGTY